MLQIKDLAFSTSVSELEWKGVIGGALKVNKAKPKEDRPRTDSDLVAVSTQW